MRMSFPKKWHQFSSVQSLSCVWLFASSWTAAPRPPCMSPTAGVHPNPCPLSQWCHPTISSSVIPFSSCPQSFPHQQSRAAAPYLVSEVAPLSCPWPWAWGSSSRPLPLNLGVGYSHEPGGKGGNWNVGKRFYICLTGNNSWLSYLEQTSLIDPFIVPVYLRCNLRIHFQPQVSGSHYQSIQHRLWEEASLPFLYQVISKVFILCKHYIHGRQLSTWPSLSL